jgi:hypothetical protein
LSGEELRVVAEEQAALRRVATLVARGALPEEVFGASTAAHTHWFRVRGRSKGAIWHRRSGGSPEP